MKEKLYASIYQDKANMLKLWEDVVNIECGPGCKEGIDEIGKIFAGLMEYMGCTTRTIEFAEAGNMVIGEYGDTTKPFIILTGHMDTVFKYGTAAERPFKIVDGKAYGPGVLDMKGGIILALYTLKALIKEGYSKYGFKVILLGDEEVGHKNSNAPEIIMQEAQGALAAFNFETGFIDDGIVVERKGMYQFDIEVLGKGAHVGNDPENGRSAIKEIAHKLLAIEALTDFEKGSTYNVGVIEGGTVCNATPAYAKIVCDLRYVDDKALPEAKKDLAAIVNTTHIEGTTTTLKEGAEFKPMMRLTQSMELFELVKKVSAEEGFPIPYPKAIGGASDSAYTTAVGIPTVCSMGVKGARNHTVEEFALVDSMQERAKLLAATILAL